MKISGRTNRTRRAAGLALVETSLVLIILVLLTLGVIEYGWMFYRMHQLTNATRHGARLAVLPDATNSTVSDGIDQMMTLADMGSSGYSVTYSPGDVAAAAKGEVVNVSISVPYSNNLALMNMAMLPVPANLQSSVAMAKEGP